MHATSISMTRSRQTRTPRSAHRSTRSTVTRPRVVTVAELLILVLTCSLVLVALFVAQPLRDVSDVPTRIVRVRSSETLWDIATANPIEGLSTAQTVEILKSVNRLEDSRIATGQSLQVPCVDNPSVALANP